MKLHTEPQDNITPTWRTMPGRPERVMIDLGTNSLDVDVQDIRDLQAILTDAQDHLRDTDTLEAARNHPTACRCMVCQEPFQVGKP